MFNEVSGKVFRTGGIVLAVIALASFAATSSYAQPRARTGSLRVVTGRPGSVVFINNIRHGATNDAGVLELPRAQAGSYPIKVRTSGFADYKGSVVIAAGGKREIKVTQQPTSDQALLSFQKGEGLRDSGQNEEAVEQYKAAIEQRSIFPEARVAMTRCLITLQDYQEAEKQILTAIKQNKGPYPEAQTVLANLRRNQGLTEESITEYRKALRLARNISPEAHIGLAIALEEQGEMDEAIKEYRIGISQDMDTESILYYLLGSALEKVNRNKEAIAAYRNYLRLDPEGMYSSAVESIIEKLKEQPDGQQ
jgi:tetratricopeptide (TPR) repeat protein